MKYTLAIQFVNYKTKKYLQASISDVLKDAEASGLDYHVYVLDNASGDDLSDLQSEHVTVKMSDTNSGFGAGHNQLSLLHDCEYTLLLNPDVRLIEEDTLARMIDSLNEEPAAVALGVRLVGKNKKQQGWDHGELDLSSGADSPKSFWEPRNQKGEVAWVSGAATLIKTAAFKNVSGFDEVFFLYKEEEDLLLRLRQKGLKTFYDPTITILHYGSVVANKSLPYFEQSIAIYDRKHGLK